MVKGQKVSIIVDEISGHTFTGYIDSFSPGSGSVFALLPPENATGNFTKIVQRVPVKIVFDRASTQGYEQRLVPGLSVETDVSLSAPPAQ
jgi:membrane fusion protein (multidrug efflux system)